MYDNIGARIPRETRKDIEYVAQEEQVDKSKIIRDLLAEAVKKRIIRLAIEKYARRKVSIGRAAELARIPIADFMVLLAEQKVPFNYTLESLKEDMEAAKRDEKRA